MKKVKIYLDNCCFNRPFDEQHHLSIKIETECKLLIQQGIKNEKFFLCWSYIIDFENEQNPFLERKIQIQEWRKLAIDNTEETDKILNNADDLTEIGLKPLDALHVSCSQAMKANYFITVDRGILKLSQKIKLIEVVSPIDFVRLLEE